MSLRSEAISRSMSQLADTPTGRAVATCIPMSSNSADVIVVGGGVMGAAAAYALAKDARRVLLFEQFAIGHALGSSHGPSRIIRLAYEGADYVRLARAAYALWHDLESEAGQDLFCKVGGLDLGHPDAYMLEGVRRTYDALGIPY